MRAVLPCSSPARPVLRPRCRVRSALRRALAGTAGLVLALAAAAAEPDADATQALHALFERQWDGTAQRLPEWATYNGDHRFDDRLADVSDPAVAERDALARQWLAEAEAIAPDKLSPTDRLSREMFISAREREVAMQPFTGWRSLRVGGLFGAQAGLSELLRVTPTATVEQAEHLLARLAQVPRRMEQEIALMRRGVALGWVPARDVLLRALQQIDAQIGPAVDDGPYWAPFQRLGSEISADERARLQAEGLHALEHEVVPAMKALRAFIVDEYLPHAPASGALGGYPDGERVYERLVRDQTTTEYSPREIHAIGQRELARLRDEMEAVKADAAFSGPLPDFVRYLNSDRRFFFADPNAMLTAYRDLAKRIDAELPRLLAELPRAPYGVRAMPAFRGPDAAEYYDAPARDGTRAGYFNANVQGLDRKPRWAMPTLVAHEAVPGHHVQIARALELADLPEFRRAGWGNTAFVEGWAVYAETLGREIGLYDDPYALFGHLQSLAFRAARLVVDTGLHAMGWSRQQAIDFMVQRTGLDARFVASEVDRYTSTPAQALSYTMGALKIIELRDRARAALGPRFDLRRFHNAVLDQGALPLDTLERVIDAWIAAEAGRPSNRPAPAAGRPPA